MSKIKKPKPATSYTTFHALARAWQLRADNLRFAAEHSAANNVESCALEMSAMAGIDLVRPTMIAYAWKDLQGIGGKIVMQVGFQRPTHVPVDAVTVLRGPPIPEQDMVTGASIKPVDTLRVGAILDDLEDWKKLKAHFLTLKDDQSIGKAYGISVAIDAVMKTLTKIPDRT
jgi:hypothetical protein